MTTRHGPRLNGTNEGPPLGGPMEVGPPLGGPTKDNRLLFGAVAPSPSSPMQFVTTGHGPRLDGAGEDPPIGGPTEAGPPLGGPTKENRLLLGVVVLSPTQSGTTGPSPTRLVTTGSCQHTGPTCMMTTRHSLRHSGLTNDGPRLRGPTDESHLPVDTAALSPTRSDTTESSPRHIDPAPRPISSRLGLLLGLLPPQMADVSNGPDPDDDHATIFATALLLALLDQTESCTSSPQGR